MIRERRENKDEKNMEGEWKESGEKGKWQWCVMRIYARGDHLSFHHR